MQHDKPKHGTPNRIDTEAAVQALEYLFAAGYVSKKRLYFANFMRGIFFSIGTIVGLALVSTIVIGVLSQFDQQKQINNLKNSIERALDAKTDSLPAKEQEQAE